MSITTEAAIWAALKSRVDSLPFGWTVAYRGELFTVPGAAPFLRVGIVSASPARMFVADGGHHERDGVLIVTISHPLGRGYTAQNFDQIAGTIAEHFVDGTKMRSGNVCVTVTAAPHVLDGVEDNGYWTQPVRIAWRCSA